MPTFIREDVNIYKLPDVDIQYSKNDSEVTIGDLHGNSMKLMFMLIKHGVAKGISDDDYKNLVEIYKKVPLKAPWHGEEVKELTKTDITEFNQILDKLVFNPEIGVRLIGDELADRGSNDYFTLKILEKLRKNNVPVEITVSNHSIDFLHATEKQRDFKPPMLQLQHAQSLYNLQQIVEKGLVTHDEIIGISDSVYKPSLKAISYSLTDDKTEITIFSHAGIGLDEIKKLAKQLNVRYTDKTAKDLANTIDDINRVFQQKHVQTNKVHELYKQEDMIKGYSGYADLRHAPFVFIMWNRLYDFLTRPSEKNNYKINFAHGHDNRDATKDNIYNLDGNLGKMVYLNEGEYTVLYSPNNTIALATETIPSSRPVSEHKEELPDQDESPSRTRPIIDELTHGPEDKTIIELSDLEKSFQAYLEQIRLKGEKFKKREGVDRYNEAHNAADTLYKTVKGEFDTFTQKKDKTQDDVAAFKKTCEDAINKSRDVLEKHRGWKQILGHLALAVLGLGIFYAAGVAAYHVSGSKFTLFKTDSHKKLDDLEAGLEELTKPKDPSQ